jgi:hypothetical protein
MKSTKTWVNLGAPVVAVGLIMWGAFAWINGIEASPWMAASKAHTALGVFSVIGAITVINCGLLLGVAAVGKRLRGS